MTPESIAIKGIRQGLLVTLGEGGWRAQLRALRLRLEENPAFFRGGSVALDVGTRELDRAEIEKVRAMLARHEVELGAVVSTNPITEAAAQELGLVIDLGPARPRQPAATPRDEAPPVEGLLVRRTLRSGQSLRHPGHVVIIGDVHPGAEVVAGGNIIVWGRARGLVHAGALGDEEAVICALELSPTQLRIAGHIARSPEAPGAAEQGPVPEMASMYEGRIVAVPWSGG